MLVTSAGHKIIIMEDVDWQDDRYLQHFAQEAIADSGRITLWDINSTQFCTNPSSLKGAGVGELHKNVKEDRELRTSIIRVFGESCCLSKVLIIRSCESLFLSAN